MKKKPAKKRIKRAAKRATSIWFSGPSVVELYRRLTAVNPERATFMVNLPEDLAHATLEVLDPAADPAINAPAAPINEAHPCPPLCILPTEGHPAPLP
jgi:hypothetical protein